MASVDYDKARELWESFRKEVMYGHRFFPSHCVLDKLEELAKRCVVSINPGTIFYRARIIDDNAARTEHMIAKCYSTEYPEYDHTWYRNKENKFWGLCKEGSYVPPRPELIRGGRSNPRFIRYLYMAESPTTAVFEVRPILYRAVNVSGIEVKQPLTIANIATDITPDNEKNIDGWLLWFIQSAFSSPTTNSDDYIPSQIIAEYLRHLGYDGIRYSSSLHRGGYNLTVFDVSKCEAVFSSELRLENMKISMCPAIGAENIDGHFEYIIDNIPMRLDRDSKKLVETKV